MAKEQNEKTAAGSEEPAKLWLEEYLKLCHLTEGKRTFLQKAHKHQDQQRSFEEWEQLIKK